MEFHLKHGGCKNIMIYLHSCFTHLCPLSTCECNFFWRKCKNLGYNFSKFFIANNFIINNFNFIFPFCELIIINPYIEKIIIEGALEFKNLFLLKFCGTFLSLNVGS
jgi:hypothetical protein